MYWKVEHHTLAKTYNDHKSSSSNTHIISAMEAKIFTHWCNTVGLQVKPHQILGYKWCMQQETASHHPGGIICDEMGLGETILMLGCIATNPKQKTLIVIPPALLEQWRGCIEKYPQTQCVCVSRYYGENRNTGGNKRGAYCANNLWYD